MASQQLAAVPVIESLGDVDRALLEIGQLSTRLQQADAALKAENSAAKQVYAERTKCRVEGVNVSIEDRCQVLWSAVEAYVAENRDAIIPAGSKSRKLDFGVIGFRQAVPKVEFLPGQKEKSVKQKLQDFFYEKIMVVVRAIRGHNKAADSIVRVKLELNREDILKAHAEKKLTNDHLAKFGVCVTDPGEAFYLETASPGLQGHLATPAA